MSDFILFLIGTIAVASTWLFGTYMAFQASIVGGLICFFFPLAGFAYGAFLWLEALI